MVEVIHPKSEADWLALRVRDVTSTETPALFNCSPHTTRFELAHRKRSAEIVAFEPNERMRWGTRLQDAAGAGIAEDQGWKVRRMTEYMRDPEISMGASFDFDVNDGEGLLEVKIIDYLAFRDGWIVDGDTIEAPPHIEIQLQQQLALSGRKWGAIGALVGGNRAIITKRLPDPDVIGPIREKIAKFWEDVRSGRELVPDFTQDSVFIARLYAQSVAGKVLDVRNETEIPMLAAEYARLGTEEKRAKEARDAIKAQILMKIGDAAKVVGNDFSITAGTVNASRVESFERAAYRNFRINWKKAGAK